MRQEHLVRNLRIDLGDTDPDSPLWSEDEVVRTIEAAVGDIDRILPLTKFYEVTISPTITNEDFDSDYGVWVSLANAHIKPKSETIHDGAGTSYTRDTDFEMDYINGKVKVLSTGSMSDSTGYKANYTKSQLGVDLSSLTDLVRVTAVEYPAGKVPQAFVGYQVTGDWLTLTTTSGATTRSQTEQTEGEHLVVHYDAINTVPSKSESGSFPRLMDQVLMKGALAYSFYIRATKLQNAAGTDLDSARSELEDIAAIITLVETALGNVATPIGEADTALDKIGAGDAAVEIALGKVGTASDKADTALDRVATLGGEAQTALAAVATLITEAAGALTSIDARIAGLASKWSAAHAIWDGGQDSRWQAAQAYLTTGATLINTVTLGADAANLYARFSDALINMANLIDQSRQTHIAQAANDMQVINSYLQEATQHIAAANARTAEASQRVAVGNSYIGEASQRSQVAQNYLGEAAQRLAMDDRWVAEARGRMDMATAYIQEAAGHLNEIQWKLASASQYSQLAVQDAEIATKFREEGLLRYADYMNVLKDRAQWVRERVSVPRNQPKA